MSGGLTFCQPKRAPMPSRPDAFRLPPPAPLGRILTGAPRLAVSFARPAALEAAALTRPAAFDLEAAQHNLRKAFLPAKD